jgi:hypothetical protein
MTDSTQAPPAEATPEPEKTETPEVGRKIALLGSAISSVGLAPFYDKSWEIWGCSPANKNLPRVDVWFELHNVELKKREGLTEWMEWLAKQPIVYMQKGPSPEFPLARAYPLREMVLKYGAYLWTSQIAYMLAAAIEQKPESIGIYGVDMAANSEYNQQRLACQMFIQIAKQNGIDVIVPPESDLLEPPPLYGFCESSRHYRKLIARSQELHERINNCRNAKNKNDAEEKHLVGALDDLEYQLAHWGNRSDFYA